MLKSIKKLIGHGKSRTEPPPEPARGGHAEPSDYERRIRNEQAYYAQCENVHELPDIFHYWSNKYLAPAFRAWGFASPDDFFFQRIRQRCASHPGRIHRVLSVGSGNCDLEARLAQQLTGCGLENFRIACLDINPDMLRRGRAHADSMAVLAHLEFVEADFNRWTGEAASLDVVMANQSLHHVLELEHLFDAVHAALEENGEFLISDMIGRNGHMRWPEALEAMRPFWAELPDNYRYNQLMKRREAEYINHDCSDSGFEGIRAQDILPLLVERFGFELFFPYANIVFPFIDRPFGHNFDANGEWDRDFIDRLHARDQAGMLSGELTPTSMLAVAVKGRPETRLYDPRLTPERCIRRP